MQAKVVAQAETAARAKQIADAVKVSAAPDNVSADGVECLDDARVGR